MTAVVFFFVSRLPEMISSARATLFMIMSFYASKGTNSHEETARCQPDKMNAVDNNKL